jgi:2-polyprenyl-3-methyl-5-hydroxy-6-metoxy-1,4-benzoquinol methylase
MPDDSIRDQYLRYGARGYYEQFGAQYHNPHELAVRRAIHAAAAGWSLDLTRVLDLACGSGEVTLALRELGATNIQGLDPFTGAAYQARTGQLAEGLSFEAIAGGALDGRRYSLVVCSYALHLLTPSRLPRLAYQLSRIADALLVLTPHKRPHLRPEWGWELTGEMVVERVRARCYRLSL